MCSSLRDWRLAGCVLDLCLLPLVCVIGLILNCLCLSVFKTRRKHPLVPALMVLSFCDLMQLFLSIFVLIIPAIHDYMEAPLLGILGQIAFLATGLLSPLLLASNCASIWTMCYITIQRHRAILKPLIQIQSPPRPFVPLFIIAVAALFFNASKWAEFDWYWLYRSDVDVSLQENALPIFLAHQQSALGRDQSYRKTFDLLLYPVLVYITPLFLLTILNLRILSNISLRKISFDHKSRLAQERRSVTLLISIVLFFFFCHTGGLAYRWMELSVYQEEDWSTVVKDVVNFLFNFNSACNPLLYFLFTRQFRDLRSTFNTKKYSVNPAERKLKEFQRSIILNAIPFLTSLPGETFIIVRLNTSCYQSTRCTMDSPSLSILPSSKNSRLEQVDPPKSPVPVKEKKRKPKMKFIDIELRLTI